MDNKLKDSKDSVHLLVVGAPSLLLLRLRLALALGVLVLHGLELDLPRLEAAHRGDVELPVPSLAFDKLLCTNY